MGRGDLLVTVTHVGVRDGGPLGSVVPPGTWVVVLDWEGTWVRALLGDGRVAWIDGMWLRGPNPSFHHLGAKPPAHYI